MVLFVIRKYKNEIFILCLTILFFGINCYNYINQSLLVPVFSTKGLNALSFWYFVRTANIGEILLFLSPILITIFATTSFYKELSSGIYQNIILKSCYKKYIIKNIVKSYIKAICYTLFSSIIIFIIGKILFSDKILYVDSPLEVLGLPNLESLGQYSYLLISILYNCIYSIIIVNISLIIFSRIKKQHIAIIRMFIILMFINYGIYFILTLIAPLIKNIDLVYIAESINIFQGYIPSMNYFVTAISLFIWLLVSTILLVIAFKKRQKVFDLYE